MWRLALEGKGLRIIRSKLECIKYEFDERERVDEIRSVMTISGDEVSKVESFKYLRSLVQKKVGFDEDV